MCSIATKTVVLPFDIMEKILRMSSDESYRRFCKSKLVYKGAVSDAPFKLKFDSISEFYDNSAGKYTLEQLRNPDSEDVKDFRDQLKVMVDAEKHLYPEMFPPKWVYKSIMNGFIIGNCGLSADKTVEETRARTMAYIKAKLESYNV